MTNSPNSEDQHKSNFNQRLQSILFSRTAIALGIPLLLGLAGGTWWVWNFINEDLAPLVEKNLAQTLNRPVKLGAVESFSLSSLQFGASSVPATGSDPDSVAIEKVEVKFDLLPLVFSRTLHLDVTLVNPDIYIQQDQQGRWVSTTIAAGEGEGPIATDLDTIRLRNADIVLVSSVTKIDKPSPQNTVAIASVDGVANIRENNQLIAFDLGGKLARGGTLQLEGEFRPATGDTNFQVQTQNFLASDLTRLIKLPLELQAGRVDSKLKVQLTPEKVTGIYGTADVRAVTAQVNQLPQPFINTQGTLRFQGTQIRLDNVKSSYGKIGAIANGFLDTAANYNISAFAPAVTVAAAKDTLNLSLPVPITGVFQANVKLTGPIAKPVLSGRVNNTKPVRIDRVNFSQVNTNFALSTATSEITFKNIQAIPTVGGKITGNGTIGLAQQPKLKFNVAAQNVPGDAIAKAYGVTTPNVKIGSVSAQTQVSGTAANPRTVVNWLAPQATYPGTGQIVIANANNLLFRDTVFKVAGGIVRAGGQLVDRRWQASVQAAGIRLGRIAQVPPTLQSPVGGTFQFSGTLPASQSQTIEVNGSGRVTGIAGGILTATDIRVAENRWQTRVQARDIQLRQLAQVPPQLQGKLAGTFNLAGSTESFEPETLQASGQGRLNIAGGTVTASNIQLAKGQWQTLINASQVQLNQFNQQLEGQLNGQLKAEGTVDAFNLAGISAAGQVELSRSLIGQPVTAAFRWNGDNLVVPQITAPNLKASGVVAVKVEGAGAPEITGLNFDVQAQNYNLQNLPFQLPNAASVSGKADFVGKISGTLPVPNVVGSVRLEDLVVNNVAFDPVLAGNVQLAAASGLDLELTGNQNDQIAVDLDSNYRPNSFIVRLDSAVATGRTQGENLLVNVENFPLTVLNITPSIPAVGLSRVAGILSGDFEINRETFAVEGDVAIANPAIGQIRGDQFVAQFRYANGSGTLKDSQLILGESRYALAGSFTQTPKGPQFQGAVNISQGKIQDILAALQISDIQDIQNLQQGLQTPTYAKAQDLGKLQVGLPNTPLLTQLRRFSEIEVLLQQQRQQRQNNSPLPSIADLEGTFSGKIGVNSSPKSGLAVNFDLEGNNWKWGGYKAEQIISEGSFENGVLTLLPLRIQSDQSLLAFNGRIGGEQQSGQLRVRKFPLEVLKNFVQLPVDFSGNLSATATLAGSIANPQAIGELQITEGTLNQQPVKSATATFDYANARLSFGSDVVVTGPNPIEITGSIPIQLPFAAVAPDSNLISLDLSVENEGLALLNLLTDQVAWQDGQGQVQLEVRGTTEQPVATGLATVQNATITAQALPAPLTDVTGKVLFDQDRIVVESVRGNFSRGEVVAAGVIPIFGSLKPQDPDVDNPLTVTLDQLALNLEQLYQGDASGNVVVTGSALNPVIGGEIRLSDGDVFLPAQDENAATATNNQPTSNSKATPPGNPKQVARGSQDAGGGTVPQFNDLHLTLGDDIEIVLPPILNFQANGTLTINGTLNDLRPDGTIRLRRGSVNLFTTQFVLERDYKHTATFTPKQDLDPILDIQLAAGVPEVTRTRVPSSTISSSEIADETLSTNVGGLQTVRVEATVKGPASQLFENLELTSTPSRSRSEIIALIGGGFVQTLGRGDSAVGLANIAGSALLSTYQGTFTNIGNALGLSELRLFPAVITDEERSRSSTLGLAAEAGVDITNNIYFSVLANLTADQSAYYGLSYRLNPQTRIRASTDLSGDSRALIEYENQF